MFKYHFVSLDISFSLKNNNGLQFNSISNDGENDAKRCVLKLDQILLPFSCDDAHTNIQFKIMLLRKIRFRKRTIFRNSVVSDEKKRLYSYLDCITDSVLLLKVFSDFSSSCSFFLTHFCSWGKELHVGTCLTISKKNS